MTIVWDESRATTTIRPSAHLRNYLLEVCGDVRV